MAQQAQPDDRLDLAQWRPDPDGWRSRRRKDLPPGDLADAFAGADRLMQRLQTLSESAPGRRLAIAYSGGVDSATLVALAVEALGADRVLAVLGTSASLATREHRLARGLADHIGVQLVELSTNELDVDAYRANGVDRCFHCKHELFTLMTDTVMAEWNVFALAYGENADDAERPDRPGSAAATTANVLRPLADAGLTKAAVRELARDMGLPVADKPAAPCLASRVPHGEAVTGEKLAQIEAAEDVVLSLGFSDCRVRHHGDVARIEVPTDELGDALAQREQLLVGVRAAGFRFVTLDLNGIQSGAFTLPLVQIDALG